MKEEKQAAEIAANKKDLAKREGLLKAREFSARNRAIAVKKA